MEVKFSDEEIFSTVESNNICVTHIVVAIEMKKIPMQ